MTYLKKIILKGTLIASLLIALGFALVKVFLIKPEREFIEPMSIFTSLLSVVIFVYGFILAPTISEYKECEKLIRDVKLGIENILHDITYFAGLKPTIETKNLHQTLARMVDEFYEEITENKHHSTVSLATADILLDTCIVVEQAGVPANHLIRFKQEVANVKKAMARCLEVKRKDSLPRMVHNLKNFITFLVLLTLLFVNLGKKDSLFVQLQEGVMLFLISFLYVYLSAVIKSLDDPFDKRNFSGYIDIGCIKQINGLKK